MDRFAKNSKFSIHDCTIVFHGKRVGTATAASRKDAKKLACRMAANYLRDHRHAMRRVGYYFSWLRSLLDMAAHCIDVRNVSAVAAKALHLKLFLLTSS